MKLFYYLYCIAFFVVCVTLAMLFDFGLWLYKLPKRVYSCIKRFGRRVYWSFMHATRHFDKLGR